MLITRMGEDAYRKRLFRFAVYFMTAHEYAHILNGDCEQGRSEQVFNKETKADDKALELVFEIIPFQYRLASEILCIADERFF
mgnify:CR=1 FL=1